MEENRTACSLCPLLRCAEAFQDSLPIDALLGKPLGQETQEKGEKPGSANANLMNGKSDENSNMS